MLNAISVVLMAKMGNMKDKNIPKIVKKLRIELGLTQEQFAAKIGVTFSTVNRWENRRGTLNIPITDSRETR